MNNCNKTSKGKAAELSRHYTSAALKRLIRRHIPAGSSWSPGIRISQHCTSRSARCYMAKKDTTQRVWVAGGYRGAQDDCWRVHTCHHSAIRVITVCTTLSSHEQQKRGFMSVTGKRSTAL
ncbi:hypothetical protein GDO81_027537 [Engystomops pustulosus]|uniref:Uncharacterized protein n=1 Tax=Engystomops pustulosus TaxID=76066 RepID=A0AAV6YKT6_ENGPU|nr:hypothetical protein GDO81_027537 [Engystomops pustulosus]